LVFTCFISCSLCVSRVRPMCNQSKLARPYTFDFPDEDCTFRDHFSSLLLSGDVLVTLLEVGTLGGLTAVAAVFPQRVNVAASMPLREVAALLWTKAVVTRLYNTYCEAIFFAFPQHRVQPSREHALKQRKDLSGRDEAQLDLLVRHDRWTLLSQFAFNVSLYYALPGYYPAASDVAVHWEHRLLRLLVNHYLLSFGMYWMHRALHNVPWLWENIHSVHHWARHPLSRNTYQDHWLDNLANAIVGHCCAQVLVPLDRGTFWFSHIFRILESVEKHSGVSCHFNVVHQMQRCLPFAQMPHHHDWHHEGHKGSNYTFTSIGGVWDCIFGTRKAGRAKDLKAQHVTPHDLATMSAPSRTKSLLDHPVICLTPVCSLLALAAFTIVKPKAFTP